MNKRGHVLNAVLLAVGLGYLLESAGDLRTLRTVAEVFVPVVLGALFPNAVSTSGNETVG